MQDGLYEILQITKLHSGDLVLTPPALHGIWPYWVKICSTKIILGIIFIYIWKELKEVYLIMNILWIVMPDTMLQATFMGITTLPVGKTFIRQVIL